MAALEQELERIVLQAAANLDAQLRRLTPVRTGLTKRSWRRSGKVIENRVSYAGFPIVKRMVIPRAVASASGRRAVGRLTVSGSRR